MYIFLYRIIGFYLCESIVLRLYGHSLLNACGNRVSSVLNRDNKQFGKKFMFDNQDETCWNSDQVS